MNYPNTLAIKGINFALMEWILTKIKAIRKSKGISQDQLAELIGVDLKTYGNWETGRTDLTFRNLEKIAKALQVDVKMFWNQEDFTSRDQVHRKNNPKEEEESIELYREIVKTKNEVIQQQRELIEHLKAQLEKVKQ